MTTSAQAIHGTLAPARTNPAMRLIHDTWTLYRRAIIRMTRTPAQLYFSLVQPLIWFLLFGQVFARLTTGFGQAPAGPGGVNPIAAQFGTDNYSAFFLPAIVIQMMLFGGANSALGIITDDLSGYLNKLRVAPINRFAILTGGLLADLTRMMIQTIALLIIGIIFGVHPAHWELLPLALVIAALFGLMMGGLGIFIGLRTRNTQATFLVINFFTLPLLFTSSAQLPVSFLPDWLQTVARLNPLTYAIDGLRAIITGLNASQIKDGATTWSVVGMALLVLIVLSALTLTLATRMFTKQIAK